MAGTDLYVLGQEGRPRGNIHGTHTYGCTGACAHGRPTPTYRQGLGHDGCSGQGSVLDDHKVALILICNLQLIHDVVCRLAQHHGAEQLATQPGTATGGNALLNNRNLQRGGRGSGPMDQGLARHSCLWPAAAD